MASAKKNFSSEDFSRFLIREFLKKSGFDRTYDIFMTEDTRPKVTMTKSELTNLLGMETLVRQNSKSKTFNTMLDIISNYLQLMKNSHGGITIPSASSSQQQAVSSKPATRTSNVITETTQASTSSIAAQPQQQTKPSAMSFESSSTAAYHSRAAPATANPYSSKPEPIGASKTSQNFFQGGQQRSIGGAPSSNSLFGGSDQASQPVKATGPNKNNFTNVVADDDDDDWDQLESPAKVVTNAAQGGNLGFFNKAPGAAAKQHVPPAARAEATKASTLNNRQVPSQQQNAQRRVQNQGFMKNVPIRDDHINDFDDDDDDDDWGNAQNPGKGVPNPIVRQQVNAMRPMTSGKPGQRGYHGIGGRKGQQPSNVLKANDDDLDDVLDGMGFSNNEQDPLTALNQKKASAQKKKQQKPQVVEEDDNDPLGFLKKAAEESKQNQQRRNLAAQEAITSYKDIREMVYNVDGYQPAERDSMTSSGGLAGGQTTNLTPQETSGIKKLLFRSESGSFHPSWAQGFYFDKKMKYAIFQDKGGPCGILATVQAFFIKHLLFVQKQTLHEVNIQLRNSLLASAITDVLLNAASGNPSGAVQLCLPQSRGFGGGRGGNPIQPSQCTKQTIGRGPEQRRKVIGAVQGNIGSFVDETGPGVVCLVYSVILSKGVDEMEADFDFEIGLINEYGYASQELINAMLVGRSTSNCHDGDKQMGDDLVLKGVTRRSEIGFLTLYEHYGHFEVGQYMKKPVLPIWIVCSESHYSILFSTNIGLASSNLTANSQPFDLIYYDELSRQQDDIILTVEPGKYQAGGKRGRDGRVQKEHTIPIDSVIRTKWPLANVNWNGRTVIL